MALTLTAAATRLPRRFEHSVLAIDAHTEGETTAHLSSAANAAVGSMNRSAPPCSKSAPGPSNMRIRLRKQLMLEPRGHADMYGCWLTEPTTTDGGTVGVSVSYTTKASVPCAAMGSSA